MYIVGILYKSIMFKGVYKMNEKVIYSKRVAYELRKRGFRILRMGVNPYRPQFDIWIFEETPALLDVLTELSER